MNKFLRQISFFLVVIIVIIFISAYFYGNLKNNYLKNKNFKINIETTTLILGDSHSQTTFDDKKIPHSKNISFHAEHYIFTYFKLLKILSANPQITNVVLSFGPHNISQGSDISLFSSQRTSRSFARYFMLLDANGVKDIYSPSQNWRINYLKWKYNIPFQLKLEAKLIIKVLQQKEIKLRDYPFIGSFHSSNKHVFKDVSTPIKIHYYSNGNELKKSEIALKYFYKIIELCDENNIKLILVNTPQHKEYRNLIPQYFVSYYKKTVYKVSQLYPNVIYIDYSDYQLSDSCFGDYHHVNNIGSEIITNELLKSPINYK